MARINNLVLRIICVLFSFTVIYGCVNRKNVDLIKVLILSGKNNHEWQKTTPQIENIYNQSGQFKIETTDLIPSDTIILKNSMLF
jgi:hypothetical protein